MKKIMFVLLFLLTAFACSKDSYEPITDMYAAYTVVYIYDSQLDSPEYTSGQIIGYILYEGKRIEVNHRSEISRGFVPIGTTKAFSAGVPVSVNLLVKANTDRIVIKGQKMTYMGTNPAMIEITK